MGDWRDDPERKKPPIARRLLGGSVPLQAPNRSWGTCPREQALLVAMRSAHYEDLIDVYAIDRLPAVRALEMMRFAGFRAFSLLQMDALNLLASALVTHLHLCESCTAHFRGRRSVSCLWLAHRFPREVRL